jgi:hypothetical protein
MVTAERRGTLHGVAKSGVSVYTHAFENGRICTVKKLSGRGFSLNLDKECYVAI